MAQCGEMRRNVAAAVMSGLIVLMGVSTVRHVRGVDRVSTVRHVVLIVLMGVSTVRHVVLVTCGSRRWSAKEINPK